MMQRAATSLARSGAIRRGLASSVSAEELPRAAGSAGRYSMALYQAANRMGTLDAVVSDVDAMESMRKTSGSLDEFLANPSLPRKAKLETLTEILSRGKFSPTFTQFMYVMAENGRTTESAKIFQAFQDIIAAVKGEVVVKVTSAQAFSEWELALLKKNIKQRFFEGKEMELSFETAIDEELLGGMTIMVGDRFMDLSTRTELRKLQDAIMKSM